MNAPFDLMQYDSCYRHAFPLPLNRDTALMYFAESGFYDRRCNNERVGGRTQELPSLTGLEYAVVTTEHPGQELIAVERRLRAGPEQTQAEAAYYILDGTIYQCPDLQTLLTSRLHKAVEHLKEAMKLLSQDAKFSLEDGYTWASLESGAGGPSTSGATSQPGSSKPGDRVVDLSSPTTRLALAEKLEKRRRVDEALAELAAQQQQQSVPKTAS